MITQLRLPHFRTFLFGLLLIGLPPIPATAESGGFNEELAKVCQRKLSELVQDKEFDLGSDTFTGKISAVAPAENLKIEIKELRLANDTLTLETTVKARILLAGMLSQDEAKIPVKIDVTIEFDLKANATIVSRDESFFVKPNVKDLLVKAPVIHEIDPKAFADSKELIGKILLSAYQKNKTKILESINAQLPETELKF